MKLRVSVIGTGYLGATHAACMSAMGFDVIGVDVDATKIELLSRGKVPFYEPGLEELLQQEIASGRLTFSTDFQAIKEAYLEAHAKITEKISVQLTHELEEHK